MSGRFVELAGGLGRADRGLIAFIPGKLNVIAAGVFIARRLIADSVSERPRGGLAGGVCSGGRARQGADLLLSRRGVSAGSVMSEVLLRKPLLTLLSSENHAQITYQKPLNRVVGEVRGDLSSPVPLFARLD
jgi:hypothetical protein